MTLWVQLIWGSIFLSLCLLLQIAMLVWWGAQLKRLFSLFDKPFHRWQSGCILVVTIFTILASHTVQVWIWSIAFYLNGALPDWNTAVYFILVTYTTVGYGDVVLDPSLRVGAGLASVNGVLSFGISTAFLVTAMGRLFFHEDQASDATD